jgi:hypothetical protein
MITVFEPANRFPEVKVSVPLIVGLLFNETPLALLMVRLFSAVTLLGTLTLDELPPKDRLEEEVVDRFEGVPAMAGPLSVSVFAPTVNVPEVRVSVPPTVTSPPILIPLERLMVRLLRVTDGSAVLAPLPPNVILDELPPVSEPLV